MSEWSRTTLAPGETHHLLDGRPLYTARFAEVLKFHAPGLAPVRVAGEAWHIGLDGCAAYTARFLRTFGFYEGRAAVQAIEGWHHILPDGAALGATRYAWCGNFQGGRCTVRDAAGQYFHITTSGQAAYAERHLYAGDFRDGVAVARHLVDGLCGHIDPSGSDVHGVRFPDLDVYHKGFARARDAAGWFHIDRAGRPAYANRFLDVEPFYNGFALTWTKAGTRLLINERGETCHEIPVVERSGGVTTKLKVLVLGNVGAGKTALLSALSPRVGWRSVSIDGCRRTHGDGTPEGELRAWAAFVAAAGSAGPLFLECTGTGPQIPLLRLALRDSKDRIGVLWVRSPIAVCQERAAGRQSSLPYPDFGLRIDQVAAELDEPIARSMAAGGTWSKELIGELDGTALIGVLVARAEDMINEWKRRTQGAPPDTARG